MRFILLVLLWLPGNTGLTEAVSLRGPLIQGGLVIGRAVGATRATLDKLPVTIGAGGYFVLGFGRDHPAHAVLRIEMGNGRVYQRELSVQRRRYAVQKITGLEPDKVTPPPSVAARIRREVMAIKTARQRVDDRLDFLAGFDWPASGPISGVYGSQRILNGKPRRPHFGLDIAAPAGAPVVAPAAGIVTLLQADNYFSGRTIILDHGLGLSSTFLHLSSIRVRLGQRVEKGKMIGTVGASGRATGPHLDWRINWLSQRLDPQLLLRSKTAAAIHQP